MLKTTFSLGCFLVVDIIIINLLIAGFNRRGEELFQLEGGADQLGGSRKGGLRPLGAQHRAGQEIE